MDNKPIVRKLVFRIKGIGLLEAWGATPEEVLKDLRDRLDKMDSEDTLAFLLDPKEVLVKARDFFAKKEQEEREVFSGQGPGVTFTTITAASRERRRLLSYYCWNRHRIRMTSGSPSACRQTRHLRGA